MSIFSKVSMKRPKHSTFNMSYDRKFSLNMGELVPMHIQEVVPGDVFNVTTQQMLRFAPMVSPVMHEVNVFTHFFFVPNRIIWKDWEDFITGGETGLDEVLLPVANNVNVNIGDLADYLGLPTEREMGEISLLPFLAYQMIYNEYYRDQNLQEPVELNTFSNGVNEYTKFRELFLLRKRAWNHDYFTSALPFAQKGEAVRLPLGNTASIFYEENGQGDYLRDPNGNIITSATDRNIELSGNKLGVELASNATTQASVDNSDKLKVDLEDATASTITDLRRAFKLQEWLEKNARAGSRYVESLLAHFGVRSKDARLQRPEFLGGGKSPVMISEVLQTSETETSPQGNMAGHGLNLGKNHSFKKYFDEHGYIIGIVSVMPKTSYQQGIPRHFRKLDKFDYFWPEFQHIGEQEIKNWEIFHSQSEDYNQGIFGYIPRYSEYKYNPCTVHGDFKKTLDFWHLGRIWEDFENTRPNLNSEFIECNPSRRIFAIEDENFEEATLYCHMFHTIEAKRLMSYHSDPSFK